MSVDPSIRAQVMEILSDPMSLPPEFWGYATQSWLKDSPIFPISQVFGFTQFNANSAVVVTSETRTSSTYGDLATVGPTLTGLADGKYLMIWGCGMIGSPGVSNAEMAISVNGAAAPGGTNAQAALTSQNVFTLVTMVDTVTLSNNGSNTLTAKYASSNNVFASTFSNRYLIALKYGNN